MTGPVIVAIGVVLVVVGAVITRAKVKRSFGGVDAGSMRLSEGTVKVHVSAILKALNVRSRAQAIAELTRRGVIIDAPTMNEAR